MRLHLLGVLLLVAASTMHSQADPLRRNTSLGPLLGSGRPEQGVWQWLGIPYARPPVGPLRWRAPEPAQSWAEPRLAVRFGPACAQLGSFQGPAADGVSYGVEVANTIGQPVGSEDCLTLNIWRPATAATGLPILVFVHGGSNVAGFAADPLYHGAALARGADAVVVTVQYRLGVLGFFSHPALRQGVDAASASGNFGLLDIIAALRFVRDNAEVFGGDAARVTLIGQSAGAMNAYALLLAPEARGLFHREVAMSGTLFPVPRSRQDQYAGQVVASLRVSRDTARALREMPVGDLLRATASAEGAGFSTLDGTVLPLDVGAALAAGQVNRVPLLAGLTAEEGRFFVNDAYAADAAQRLRWHLAPASSAPPTLAQALKPALASDTAFAGHARAVTTTIERLSSGTLAQLSGLLPAVWSMRMDYAARPSPWDVLLGSSHGIDLPFLFGNWSDNWYSRAFTPSDLAGRSALSTRLMAIIATFARTGGVPQDVSWPRYDSATGGTMHFDATSDAVTATFRPR